MPVNINCQCFKEGCCLHASAPRTLFFKPECILLRESTDPRIPRGCALQYPYKRPDGKPLPPPSRIIKETGEERLIP